MVHLLLGLFPMSVDVSEFSSAAHPLMPLADVFLRI